ncbi:MAG: T9SS type A sorting domain-containing protein [Cytophagales bacterium]|nr:T9SS type A sorting domain-containing protein [Cytophagales bacterium]
MSPEVKNHTPLRAILFLTCILVSNSVFGLTYYSRASGNWTNPNNWSTDAVLQCLGLAAVGTPGAGDDVFICSGFTITFNTGVGNTTVLNLTVRGTLTITANNNLTCNSLALFGLIDGASTRNLQMGNTAGSTFSGTGSFAMTAANLTMLSDMTIPNASDYLTFNGAVSGQGAFDINGRTVTNNGRVDILDPVDFLGPATSSFINNSSTAYLKYTKQASFPGALLTATAVGNTVEFSAAGAGPYTIGNTTNYHHVIVGGASEKRLAVATNIAGNLTISSGATLNVNNNNMTIGGNWVNNLGGTFVKGTRNVTFNGSTNNQTIFSPAGAAGENFYDLTINNTFAGGTVTASGNITITAGRTFTMTSGIMDMGTFSLRETAAGGRYAATGGELRLAGLTTLPELTGAYTLTGGTTTFNGAGAQTIRSEFYYSVNVNTSGGSGTKTMAGAVTVSGNLTIGAGTLDVSASNFGLTVNGNWSNTGTFVPRNGTVTLNGSGTQTFTNAASETFYGLTGNATGPFQLGVGTDVMVTNTLTMSSGDFDLNGRMLTLGNGAVATLVRISGTMYGGTFRRFLASSTAISSSAAPRYGLFPMGVAGGYRPIEINSTLDPTAPGYISATHTDGASKIDLSPTYSDGGTIMTRIHVMQSALTTSGGFGGGTYNINISMTAFVATGLLTDERLLIYTGGTTASSVGSHLATIGSLGAPTGRRTGLSSANLSNIFVIGTSDAITTPLGPDTFFARVTGNWNTPATWTTDVTLQCAGAASTVIPRSTDNVSICPGVTVTVDVTSTTTVRDITIQATGNLLINVNQILICNSLRLDGTVTGSGNRSLQIGSAAGSTLSGTGLYTKTSGDLTLLNNVTIPNAADYITFDNLGRLDLNAKTLTNNGRVDILNPSSFVSGGASAFVNSGPSSYLKYTVQGNFPNILTSSAVGNTVEFGATAGGPYTIGSGANYHHLIISGAATKNVVANPTNLAGNLTINNGSTFNSNGSNITVAGDWINNLGGSFTPGTRTVTFNGSLNNQTIFPPGGGQTFADLTINNTFAGGIVTASGNVSITVGRTLTMTSGIFDMGTNTLGQTGAANFTATGGDLRLAKTGVTLPELTSTYNITGGTITFNGAGNQTIRSLNAAPSAYHSVVIANAGNKTLGGNIQVRGNWTNNSATLVPGTNTVTFNGLGIQTITSTVGSESFYNVTTNTTGPLTLEAATDVTVTNQLALTSGFINANGRTLTLGSAGVASTLTRTASATTNWTYGGTFKRFWLASTAVSSTVAPLYGLFPMGSPTAGSNYRPIEINSTVSPTGGGFFTATHVDATNTITLSPAYNDAGTNIVGVQRAQFITAISGVTGGTYNINVTMTGLFTGTLSDIRLAVFTGGTTASAVGTHAASTGSAPNPTARRTGITTLTDFNNDFRIATINLSATPLPIELLKFSAEYRSGLVALEWQTETETNNDLFTVQKTATGENFINVAEVKGAGTSVERKLYTALDYTTRPGTWYYRLKQTDYDGKFTYSKLVAVTVPESQGWVVYPNPSNGSEINVNFSQEDLGKNAFIKLHDLSGKELLQLTTEKLDSTQLKINLINDLSPGIYFVSIIVDQRVVRQKLVVR